MDLPSLTPKQDAFCWAYIETGNASEAYRRSYDFKASKPATINRSAKALLDNPKIAARIADLRGASCNRHRITVDGLVKELEADRALARANNQASAAISATVNIARLHGLTDRGRPIQFDLPKIKDAKGALSAMAAVIEGVSRGDLTPEEGKSVSGLIETYRRTMETVDLDSRIQRLEAQS